MVAELLRLRIRVLLNAFRGRPARTFELTIALLAAIAGIAAVLTGAARLPAQNDFYEWRVLVVGGSILSLSAVLLPAMFVRTEAFAPRAFLGYPHPGRLLGVYSAVSLIGPVLLMIPIAVAPVLAWHDAEAARFAAIAAPVLFLQGVFSVRLGQAAGLQLRRHRGLSAFVRIASSLLLLALVAELVAIVSPRVPLLGPTARIVQPFPLVDGLVQFLAVTPFGLLWGAPGAATTSIAMPAASWSSIGIGTLWVLTAFIGWLIVLGWRMRPTRHLRALAAHRSGGAIARFSGSPAAAIGGRSLLYWARDPRYRTVFGILPIVPIVTVLALTVSGVPIAITSLIPLPIMVLILAWATTHNDVAYDSTAVWTHVAAHTRGTDDRIGRAGPVLAFGAVLILIGTPLSAWAHGSADAVPALLGVSLALLLGGVGIASAVSSRYPYPAPRPGDPAWQAPQSWGSQGGAAQAVSFFGAVLVAAPALAVSMLWLADGGAWAWLALLLGAGAGVIILIVGVRSGAKAWDRRAPELLAFTVRN